MRSHDWALNIHEVEAINITAPHTTSPVSSTDLSAEVKEDRTAGLLSARHSRCTRAGVGRGEISEIWSELRRRKEVEWAHEGLLCVMELRYNQKA